MNANFFRLSILITVLPKLVFNEPLCSPPYVCLRSDICAEKLTDKRNEQVLFRCGDNDSLCCPPVSTAHTNPPHSDNPSKRQKEPRPNIETSAKICQTCGRKPNDTSSTSIIVEKKQLTPKLASHRNFRLLPSKCGVIDFPNRITEGEEAKLGEFPWMVLVGFKENNGVHKWICGGTLISYRYVLTAAHCIYNRRGAVPVVRLGEHNLENATDCDNIDNICLDQPIDFDITEIKVHEKWNRSAIKNDIALFRLPQDVQVSPICLPFDMKKTNTSEDAKYEVAGWGKMEWNSQSGSSVLRKASLSGLANADCNLCKGRRQESYCPITKNQICAQGWKSVDVCKGDSGGPLMASQEKIFQIGITSFKPSEYCGDDHIPSVFTRVESYLEWILDNIKD